MILPNELRLGNFIKPSKEGIEMYVKAIFEDEVHLDFNGNDGDVWEVSISDLEPIRLTDGFIEKIKGEKYYYGGFYVWEIKHNWLTIGTNTDTGELWISWNSDSVYIEKTIKSVHEFQNIFYSITGEELQF